MNVQRFQAPTLRDALAKARQAFGDGTLILANRSTAAGYEVVATAEQALADATRAGTGTASHATPPQVPTLNTVAAERGERGERSDRGERESLPSRRQVESDTERLAMSTLSFQEYVRERMLARREAEQRQREAERDALQQELREVERRAVRPSPADAAGTASATLPAQPAPLAQGAVPSTARAAGGMRTASQGDGAAPSAPASLAAQAELMARLDAMQERIEQRLDTVAWLGQARQSPIHSGLLLKLLRAGYSPALARELVQAVAPDTQPAEAVRAVAQSIAARLVTDHGQPGLVEAGGRQLLLGPAGWGKTTTVLKLVHAAVQQHGPGSVGLITLDAQRVGAPEALRHLARSMGTMAHVAHDRAALSEMLSLLERKALVLIDTPSHGLREPQFQDTLELAQLPDIQPLVVVNAAAQSDTIDAVLAACRTPQPASVVLSRVDEAVKLAPVVDALVRHGLCLRGLGSGTRVAEDWQRVDPFELVKQTLRTAVASPHDPQADDLALHFAAGMATGPRTDSAQG